MTVSIKTPQLVFIGYTNIDINITPKEKTILPGGGAYFAAVAASLFHRPIGLITRIGKDYDPTFLFSRVLREGVCVDNHKATTRSIQTYHSETDPTDRDIRLEWGVSLDLNPDDIPSGWIENARFIHIATMPPFQQLLFIDHVRRRATQSVVSIDTDSFFFKEPELEKQIIENFSRADLIFANRLEYKKLRNTIHQVKETVVKRDKEGAFYLRKGKILHSVSAEEVQPVDVTGAGDIFAGVFLAQRFRNKSIHTCLKTATDIASKSITEPGVKHLFLL